MDVEIYNLSNIGLQSMQSKKRYNKINRIIR